MNRGGKVSNFELELYGGDGYGGVSEGGNSCLFPNGDELILVNIMEYVSHSITDLISCANVCSDWRRVCESPLMASIQFSNLVYSRKVYGKVYRRFENPECYHFFNYFSTIKISLVHSGESQNIMHRLLRSEKCERLVLSNFNISFSEIVKRNITAPHIKTIEMSKCNVDSFDNFDRIFPNLQHLKFSGFMARKSLTSFSKTLYTRLESINMEYQNEEQFLSLICPSKPCVNMKELHLYSKLEKSGEYQSKLKREYFPQLRAMFFSLHSAFHDKILQECDIEAESLRIRSRVSPISLSNMSSLTHLEVKTVSSLDHLSLPFLKTLILDSNYNDKAHSVKIQNVYFPNLENLTISDKKATVDLSTLIQFSKLKKLDIDCTSMNSLQTIRELTLLEDISISSQFENSDLKHLTNLKITKLRILSRTTTIEEQFSIIPQLENLKHLEFYAENIEHFRLLSKGKLSNITYLKLYHTKYRMDFQSFLYLANSNMKNISQLKFQSLDEMSAHYLITKNPFPKLRVLKIRKSFNFSKKKHMDTIRTLLLTVSETSLHEIHLKFDGDYTKNPELEQIISTSDKVLYIEPRKWNHMRT